MVLFDPFARADAASPFMIPFIAPVPFARERLYFRLEAGQVRAVERRAGLPGFAQRSLDLFRPNGQLRDELGMLAMLPVLRLARRMSQELIEQGQIEVVKNRSMKKKPVPFSTLGVAREFSPRQREICVTGHVYAFAEQCFAGRAISVHDKSVRR